MPEIWRVVFMGTPEFAGPALTALAESDDEIVLVVTQPDRPRGRGRKTAPPPVKVLAQDLGLPVWQPESVKGPEAEARLKALEPDLLVVVAFGGLLPPALLDLPQAGPLNVHPSLLPAYRGPAPINWAIINGETETGVTTMFLDQGMDTGPTLLSRTVPIGETETAGELHGRLAQIGAGLLVETIAGIKAGTVSPRPQPDQGVSLAPRLKKSDGLVDWSRPADELARLVRGLDPWPGAHTLFRGKNLRLFGGKSGPGQGEPGRVLSLDQGLLHVAAGQGSLAVAELQLAGKKRLGATEFWRGQHLDQETGFGE
ncbi:MAG: methionyl-tRNA formyltransferase [Thermodesulfobacteriota bacterium]|nr:methionyl-tRNA formyltransferase [Thermodesulfobacteriota bacterium]